MSNRDDNRVLSRLGARELSKQELDSVSGGLAVHTNVCSIDLITGAKDGDACGL